MLRAVWGSEEKSKTDKRNTSGCDSIDRIDMIGKFFLLFLKGKGFDLLDGGPLPVP